MYNMINIAVLGYGTVGSGVVEILNKNGDNIKKRAGGNEINVKYVLDIKDFPGEPIEDKVVHDYDIILNDPEVKIVVEVMGGVDPAYTYTKQALLNGKSVCTSNKELVAAHGPELLAISKEQNLNFLFEASVGGGIPIIRPLNQSLTADEIEEITGILNGTTNYVLSKMTNEGSDFHTVLKEAQELGYAERDPSADIQGQDSCRKIAILSSLAYGMHVDFNDIYTEGIESISDIDIKYAKEIGGNIKLLATSEKAGDKVLAMVAPMIIKSDNPLFSVNDVFNAIFVKGNFIGDVMFYGSGAGKLPTASAVVSDIVDASKHLGKNIMTIWSNKKLDLCDIKQAKHKFLVRVSANDETATKKRVFELFGAIREIHAGIKGEFAFVTDEIEEGQFEDKANELGNVISRIRIKG